MLVHLPYLRTKINILIFKLFICGVGLHIAINTVECCGGSLRPGPALEQALIEKLIASMHLKTIVSG